MKTRNNLFLQLAAAMVLTFTPSLHATALTWTGGDGTWQVGNAGQWGANWTDGDTATFSGPGGMVTLGGPVTTGALALAFAAGNYEISAGAPLPINLGATTISLGSNVTTTLGANVTVNRATWLIDGASDETSTFNLTGGKLDAPTGNTTITEATVNVNSGGVLESAGSIIGGTTADGITLNVAGGTVNIEGTGTNLILNNGAVTASVTMTISSGAINFTNSGSTNGIRFGGNGAGNTTGVFNLDGGIVTVNKVYKAPSGTVNSTFNFNGGTLRALRSNTDFMTGLTAAVVKSGGAIIDTNGKSVTLAQALTPDASSGGLTKNGLGILTLSGASTYTGATTVAAGRLNITGSVDSDVSVANGATLGGEGTANGSTGFAASGSTFTFDPATPAAFTASSLNLGGSVIQLAGDNPMTVGETYLVMIQSAGFSGSPLTNFRSPARGTLAYTGASSENLQFTFTGSASIQWRGGDGTHPTFWDSEETANWDNGGSTDKFFPTDNVLFDDTALSYTVAIPGNEVLPASVTFNNTTTYTLSGGAIGGATGITKNGPGIVALGNANSYTGTTTVNAGSLHVSGGNAIIDTGLLTLADVAGTTFRITGSETIGSITGGGAAGGNLSIDAAQTLTLVSGTGTHAGSISGAGTLALNGAVQTFDGVVSNSGGLGISSRTVTLGGNNIYTGATTVAVNSGIILTHPNGLGATGSGNETMILGSGGAAGGQIGLSGGLTFSAEKIVGAGAGHFSPATVDGFTVQQRGMIQSVSGDNTFTGDIEINSTGITRFGTQDGAQLTLSGRITRSVGLTDVQVLIRAGNSGGDFVTLTNPGNDFDHCSIFCASVSGDAGLRLGTDNALPPIASVGAVTSSAASTTLDLNGFDQTIAGLRSGPNNDGQFKIVNGDAGNPSTLTLANTANFSSRLAAISNNDGAGGVINVVKSGGFTQELGAINTYTGTTTIEGGRLSFLTQASLYNNDSSSWTPANISVASGAILGLGVGGLNGFTGSDVETIITSLTVSNGGGLKAGSTLALEVSAETTVTTALTDSVGTSGGAIGFNKSGAAKLIMTGTNSYSGDTTVSAGTLQLAAANTTNNASTVMIAATGASLELNFTGTDTVGKLFIDGVQQPADVYKAVGNPVAGTGLAQLAGTGTLTVLSGPAGFTSWQAANNTTGGLDEDHDGDGVDNGVEYFLGGSTKTTGFTALPGVTPNGSTLSITWTMAAGYTGVHNTDFVVETSDTLIGTWTPVAAGTGPDRVEITGDDVKYTFPAGTRKFARLKVTGP